MKNAYLVLSLLIYLEPSQCTLKCNTNDNCLCFPGKEFEFQCPKDAELGEFVIHVTEGKEILIDCAGELEAFHNHLLPNITLTKIDDFRMRFCPLPSDGFREILDHFSLKEIKSFQYGSFNISDVTLTKHYFQGLEFLTSLQLNADGLVNLEEDVFANTPFLTELDLQLNRIDLKRNLFKFTPMLKSLDLPENGLESIPEGLFEHLDKLEVLHLWSNSLTAIETWTFKGLTNLKSLELSSNKIRSVADDAFKSLANLSRVNLSRNQLKTLSAETFSYNRRIEKIVIKHNPTLKLSESVFSNLPSLENVDLEDCQLTEIPENVFDNSPNIQYLKLGKNKLKVLSDNLFKDLQNLVELYLDSNQIEKIGNIFAPLNKLKILELEKNHLKEIGKGDFNYLTNLEEIDLRFNRISKIDHHAFENNNNLKEIDLSFNQYSGEFNSQFVLLENVPNIVRINLSHNQITQIDDVIALYNKVYLQFLDLSHNNITNITIKDLQSVGNKLTINLEYNQIATVEFELDVLDVITKDATDAFSNNDPSFSVIYLSNNPLHCDCRNYDLARYFQNDLKPQIRVKFDIKSDNVKCATPVELSDISLENLPQNLLVCPFDKIGEASRCPDRCSCSWRPYDDSIVLDCSSKGLTHFPQIENSQTVAVRFNQTEMHLEGNELNQGPDRNLTGYENVTKLFLSYNEIDRIDWLPPQIEVLHLDNNKLTHFDYDVLNMLNVTSLINLTLDKNPWSCDCEAENFTNFLRQHTKVVDAKDLHCHNSTLLLIELNQNDLCSDVNVAAIIAPILLVLLIVASAFVFYYRYQEPLKIWLYSHNLCLWWVTEEELDKDKLYDAFISYSHKDEDFVVQNLLPVLEGGPNPYKLCIHYRNWIPGEFISTQVTNSVIESRRTLVVLSPSFLESVWGKMEFRTAHTQAMTDGRARVIIVLYGDIDMDKLDEELKAYMKTNTYVKWGDPYFWNKLKYALPHSKTNVSNNNQKIANVMNCIDDKFNLVVPVASSPGTTPPVDVVKKHPLHFVPSTELDTPPAESGTLLVSTCL